MLGYYDFYWRCLRAPERVRPARSRRTRQRRLPRPDRRPRRPHRGQLLRRSRGRGLHGHHRHRARRRPHARHHLLVQHGVALLPATDPRRAADRPEQHAGEQLSRRTSSCRCPTSAGRSAGPTRSATTPNGERVPARAVTTTSQWPPRWRRSGARRMRGLGRRSQRRAPPAAAAAADGLAARAAAESRAARSPSVTSWVRDPTRAGAAAERHVGVGLRRRGRPGNRSSSRDRRPSAAGRHPGRRHGRTAASTATGTATCGGVFQDVWAAVFTAEDLVPGRGRRDARPHPASDGVPVAGCRRRRVRRLADVARRRADRAGQRDRRPDVRRADGHRHRGAEPHRVDARRSRRSATITLRAVGSDATGRRAERTERPVRVDAASAVGAAVRRRRRRELPRHRSPSCGPPRGRPRRASPARSTPSTRPPTVTYRVREIQTIGEDR